MYMGNVLCLATGKTFIDRSQLAKVFVQRILSQIPTGHPPNTSLLPKHWFSYHRFVLPIQLCWNHFRPSRLKFLYCEPFGGDHWDGLRLQKQQCSHHFCTDMVFRLCVVSNEFLSFLFQKKPSCSFELDSKTLCYPNAYWGGLAVFTVAHMIWCSLQMYRYISWHSNESQSGF